MFVWKNSLHSCNILTLYLQMQIDHIKWREELRMNMFSEASCRTSFVGNEFLRFVQMKLESPTIPGAFSKWFFQGSTLVSLSAHSSLLEYGCTPARGGPVSQEGWHVPTHLLSSCSLCCVPFQWRGAENNDVEATLCASRWYLQAQAVSGMVSMGACGFWLLLLGKFIEEFPGKEVHTLGQILPQNQTKQNQSWSNKSAA